MPVFSFMPPAYAIFLRACYTLRYADYDTTFAEYHCRFHWSTMLAPAATDIILSLIFHHHHAVFAIAQMRAHSAAARHAPRVKVID